MPKKRTRKGFYHKKGGKKHDTMKEEEELQELDGGEPQINHLIPNALEKKAGDMSSSPSKDSKCSRCKDLIVDVGAESGTCLSALTSSVASCNNSETTGATSAAKTIVKSLKMLGSSEQQSEAFEIAMRNPLFRNLVEKYNNPPPVTHPVMPTRTPGAERIRKLRKKNSAVDSILLSINSSNSQEEKNSVMKNVLENSDASNAVLASGYIKNDAGVQIALKAFDQRNKIITHAIASAKKGTIPEDKSAFINSALMATTFTPTEDASEKKVRMADEIQHMKGISRSAAYRRLSFVKQNRKNLKSHAETGVWSGKKKRKRYRKLSDETIRELHIWLKEHPDVVTSPNSNDTLLVAGPDGEKIRVPKLLLQCSYVQLHNDLIKSQQEGGFAPARDESGKVVISDTALRLHRPQELRPMTKRHKQMCGCETCIVSKQLLLTLNAWRRRRVEKLEREERVACDKYKEQLFLCHHADVKGQIMSMMCEPCNEEEQSLPKWKCVLRRCQQCPKYEIPDEEKNTGSNSPEIVFRVYKKVYKCSLHNFLGLGENICSKCDAIEDPSKKGTLRCRRELTKMQLPISQFMTDYYLPMMEKLCYHLPHVIVLSKHHCGRMRKEAIMATVHDILTRRDYADKLIAEFDLEIQSTHFGDSVTLSMEGCSVEFIDGNGNVKMHFHFHFADKSPQNAASTNQHMDVMMTELIMKGLLTPNRSTIFEVTDGCGKQYRCGNALMYLSALARKHGIIIDRAVDAPGHGKGVVDGVQGTEKEFLRRKMCMINKNGHDSMDNRIEAAQMCSGEKTSFARECIRLCSNSNRKLGVLGDKKNKKREENRKVMERFYHYHEPNCSELIQVNKEGEGFKSGKRNGMNSHYNFRFHPRLGLGFCASRRIPCLCKSCKEQLEKPWDNDRPAGDQDMFAENKHCAYWNLFEGLNNWRIIRMTDKQGTENEDEEFQQQIIHNYVDLMAEKIAEGEVGAVSTSDDKTDGYYLVKWCGSPYTLQESTVNTSFLDKDAMEPGEMVCKAIYYNPMQLEDMKYWYFLSRYEALIPLQQVLRTGIKMHPISNDNKPNVKGQKVMRNLKRRKAVKIDESDVEEIGEEMARREDIDIEAKLDS